MKAQFETIELEGNSCFRTSHYQSSYLQDDHGWHYHPECELTFVLKGKGTRFVGDSVEYYTPGDLVLIGPNIPHCWANNQPNEDNEIITMQFLPNCLGDDFLNSPEAKSLLPIFEHAKRGLFLKGKQVQEIGKAMMQTHQLEGLPRLVSFISLLDLITKEPDYELLVSSVYSSDTKEFNSQRMKAITEYIQNNLENDIKQTDVAELVHMTPQGFSRFFKTATGRTFVSFVNVVRIMEASRLLASTTTDITDIAFQCGYGNLSNFNRRFLELKGCTPTEYRKKHQVIVC